MVKVRISESIKLNEEMSAFVKFDYNQKMVDFIRTFNNRYFNITAKEWEIPLNKLPNLLDAFPNFDYDVTGEYVSLDKKVVEVPANFKFKTNPFAHQIDGFNYGLQNDRWLLGDEQGLGKTKQVIDIAVAKKLAFGYKHCLIVCGVNGLKWNWVNEIHTHSDEDAYILGQYPSKGRIVIGSNTQKYADLEALNRISAYFIITNVETLRDEKIVAKIADYCKSGDIEMVCIDEVHKCKNPSSQQGKGILKLQPKCRIAMTGTPLMNQPLDLYIILKWLGYEKSAFYSFRNHYCVMGGYGGYEVLGYRNLDELQSRLNDIMLRRLKDDVLDLPEKIYIDEYVDMLPKQAVIYKEISAEIKNNIDQIKTSPNPLAELIRMRQATGYTGILSSKIMESAKLDRMEELVEEAVENGKKVVIFSNWTQITDEVYKRLHPKYHPAIITGQTQDEARQDEVKNFQYNDNCKVIIGTTGAMGTGLTLTAGTVEIFLDEPWNRALYDQATDRCHRVGQKSNVTIYNLMCKGTIDERIHELVQKKGAMSDALVDGKVNMNKAEILDFLLD